MQPYCWDFDVGFKDLLSRWEFSLSGFMSVNLTLCVLLQTNKHKSFVPKHIFDAKYILISKPHSFINADFHSLTLCFLGATYLKNFKLWFAILIWNITPSFICFLLSIFVLQTPLKIQAVDWWFCPLVIAVVSTEVRSVPGYTDTYRV